MTDDAGFWILRPRDESRDMWLLDDLLGRDDAETATREQAREYEALAAGDTSVLDRPLRYRLQNRGQRTGDLL